MPRNHAHTHVSSQHARAIRSNDLLPSSPPPASPLPPFPPLPPPPNLASFRTTEIRTFICTIIGALTQHLSLCVLPLCSFLKDYVLCHGTAPRHTTTYSNGTFPEVQQTLSRVWVFGGLGFWNLRLGTFPEGQLFTGFGIRCLGWRTPSMEGLPDVILERFSRI
jgi:hypothetical protein